MSVARVKFCLTATDVTGNYLAGWSIINASDLYSGDAQLES
jgi:hypothetical protein